MIYQGKVHDGVVILDGGAKLPDGMVVRVEPLGADTKNGQKPRQEDAVFRMGELAVETGIPDLAANIDHYLYGHPKVDDGR